MATQVIRNITTAAELDAFIAELPASLVTADQQWTAILADGVSLTKSVTTALASKTTNATCFIEITGVTPGAASLTNTGSAPVLDINVSFTRVSKIKLASTNNTTSAQPCLYVRSTCTNFDGHQLTLDGYGQNAALRGVAVVNGATHYLRNSLLLQRATDAAATIAQQGAGAKFINLTALSLGVAMNIGIQNATSAGTMKSCYVGNVVAAEGASFPATKTTCASSAGGAGWVTIPFSTATFISLTNNFRPAVGSALIDAGTIDAVYAATDADGNARPVGSATDIGAYEFGSGTTAVSSDLVASYSMVSFVGSDLVAGYSIFDAAQVSADLVAAYGVGAYLSSDLVGTYSVNSFVSQDLVSTYGIASAGAFVSETFALNTDLIWPPGTVVYWTWTVGGRVGAMAGKSIVEGSSTLNAESKLSLTGLPSGTGKLDAAVRGASAADDSEFSQHGTVA